MATQILDTEIWEVRFVCSCLGQVSINRLFYRAKNQLGVGGDPDDFALALSTEFAPEYKDVLSSVARFEGVSVQRAWPKPRTLAFSDTGSAGIGNAGANPLPPQVSGLIKLRTDFAGKKERGRKYLPFPDEGHNDPDGQPSAVYVARLDTLGTSMQQELTAVGPGGAGVDEVDMEPVIWTEATNNPLPITAAISRLSWATQRRRGLLTPGDTLPF